MQRFKLTIQSMAVIAGYVALIVANAFGEIFKFGGVTAADVSNEVFAWFAPAGYVFTIWSAIYIGLAVWVVRFIREDAGSDRLGPVPLGAEALLFVISSALNIAWLALWHLRQFPATIVVIVALFAVVVLLYVATRRRSRSWIDAVPISLYASWLAVAVTANIAHVATRAMPAGAGVVPAVTTLVLLAAFAGMSYLARRVLDDYVFGLVVAWAGIGIGVRLVTVSPVVGVGAILISTLGVAAALIPWDAARAKGLVLAARRARR